MKRWAVLTVAIYAIALLVLTAPIFLIAFGDWAPHPQGMSVLLEVYSWSAYWIWLSIMMGGQALFLLVPIDTAERRLPARRTLRTPVIVTALFLANFLTTGLLSVVLLIWKDDGVAVFRFLSPPRYWALIKFQNTDWDIMLGIVVCLVLFWILWAFIFGSFAKSKDPDALISRSIRWLLRGSILELLVAIPSHIIVRRRGDCCAPMGTFWGIASGISVMLLCFGPGVFFLFVERFRRLQLKRNRN